MGQKLSNIYWLVHETITMCKSYLTKTYLKISGASSCSRCIGIAGCARYNRGSFTCVLWKPLVICWCQVGEGALATLFHTCTSLKVIFIIHVEMKLSVDEEGIRVWCSWTGKCSLLLSSLGGLGCSTRTHRSELKVSPVKSCLTYIYIHTSVFPISYRGCLCW